MHPLLRILPVSLVFLAACSDKGADDSGGGGSEGSDGADGGDGGDGADGSGDPDTDGDGFPASADCDDDNADVNPGADELCNGIDDDCNELVDDDPSDATVYFGDADRDGFGDDASTTLSCELPPDSATVGGDCDDSHDGVYPGAEEICGDGVVNDCEGTVDAAAAACPVLLPEDLSAAQLQRAAGASGEFSGAAVSIGGDVNGDGYDDLLTGAPYRNTVEGMEGAAYLTLGSSAGDEDAPAEAVLTGDFYGGMLGDSVAVVPDVNGDGYDDLLVGQPHYNIGGYPGEAHLLLGPVAGELGIGDVDVSVVGSQANADFGSQVEGAGDLDGDGLCDILVSEPFASDESNQPGMLYVFLGSAEISGGSVPAESGAAARYSYTPASPSAAPEDERVPVRAVTQHRLGEAVARAGDTDGDGLDDFLVGAPTAVGPGGSQGGRAWLVRELPEDGAVIANIEDEAAASYAAPHAYSGMGTAVSSAGDVDGDGLDDVIIGAPYRYDEATSDSGAAYVFLGSSDGEHEVEDAALAVISDEGYLYLGQSVAGAGDVDGDGLSEVLIGMPGNVESSEGPPGEVLMVIGGTTGSLGSSALSNRVAGLEGGDGTGMVLAAGGDVNGDGVPDVALGRRAAAEGDGAASVLFLAPGW